MLNYCGRITKYYFNSSFFLSQKTKVNFGIWRFPEISRHFSDLELELFKKNLGNFLICKQKFSKCKFKKLQKTSMEGQLKTYKIQSRYFPACLTEEVHTLKELFESNGYIIRIVGGAVRDLLLDIEPHDLDFSTTATPQEMKEMFNKNNIRIINMNGEKHGTITARIKEKNFEVTTLRVDLLTNGRQAVVQFTRDWMLDAGRRDLTINAMYLGFDGTLYDYFNGYEDLKNKKVVFVGDSSERIQEDYLRILRYFRFYARIAYLPDNHDEDVLKAIKANKEGLEIISGERIWDELNQILSGRFAYEMLLKILGLGIGPHIGILHYNLAELTKVVDRLKKNELSANPVTVLSALFDGQEEVDRFFARVKPSSFERELAYFIISHRESTSLGDGDSIRFYKNLLLFSKMKQTQIRSYICELLKYQGKTEFLKEILEWNIPKFPVNGHMIREMGITGKNIGEVLDGLKRTWESRDFDISVNELLEQIPEKYFASQRMKKEGKK